MNTVLGPSVTANEFDQLIFNSAHVWKINERLTFCQFLLSFGRHDIEVFSAINCMPLHIWLQDMGVVEEDTFLWSVLNLHSKRLNKRNKL